MEILTSAETFNTEMSSPSMQMEDYSARSFVVFGPETKTHKTSLKNLGGKYNGRLKIVGSFPGGPAWIFSNKARESVQTFLNDVDSGKFSPSALPTEGSTNSFIPQVVIPTLSTTYQTVKYKVFKPIEGMKVTLNVSSEAI